MLSSNSVDNVLTQVIQEKFAAIQPLLNERTRRRWAAVEARALGRGGIARVAEATGLSRATISAGLQELAAGPEDDDAAGRLRGPGAGRKALAEHDAGLVAALERLVDPATRGDPTGPLRWTCSSAARLSRELQEAGHRVSERSVNRLLHALGYSLQANRKTLEGKQHPDRDAQFNHINRRVRAFQRRRQPVVSVDTKKKELVGPFEERGAGVASARSPRAGSGPRLSGQGPWQGDSVRRVRPDSRRRLGERRRRSRQGVVREWRRCGGGGGGWVASRIRWRAGC